MTASKEAQSDKVRRAANDRQNCVVIHAVDCELMQLSEIKKKD